MRSAGKVLGIVHKAPINAHRNKVLILQAQWARELPAQAVPVTENYLQLHLKQGDHSDLNNGRKGGGGGEIYFSFLYSLS